MKLAVVSDIHGELAYLAALREAARGADALVACGDFTTFGGERQVRAVAAALRDAAGVAACYFVIGNCDAVPFGLELDGWVNLHGRVARLGAWWLAGIGGALPTKGRTPGECAESVCACILDGMAAGYGAEADRLVMVSHQPPYGTAADRTGSGLQVGSRVLRDYMDRVGPACWLAGHIHEAASRSRVGKTLLVNPGPFQDGNVAVVAL